MTYLLILVGFLISAFISCIHYFAYGIAEKIQILREIMTFLIILGELFMLSLIAYIENFRGCLIGGAFCIMALIPLIMLCPKMKFIHLIYPAFLMGAIISMIFLKFNIYIYTLFFGFIVHEIVFIAATRKSED